MNVNFKSTTAAVVMIAASAIANGVAAATVNVAGFFDGSFSNVQGASTPNNIAIAGDRLTWGTPTSGIGAPGSGSSLQISSGNFAKDFPPAGEIKFGTFTWYNASSFNTGGEWTVDMTLNIDFGTPTDLGVLSEVLSMRVQNTTDPNPAPPVNENTGAIPDVVSNVALAAGAFETPVDLGEGLTLTSVFLRPDDCSPTATSAGVTTCSFDNGLWTLREGAESTIGIYGTIETPSQVPLPAAGWLLVAGIGGLFAMSRRKKA